MKPILLGLLFGVFTFSSVGATPSISINPMFLRIASGGNGIFVISNRSGNNIDLEVKVKDTTSLLSRYCYVMHENLTLKPNEEQVVSVQCSKNRSRDLHLVEVDFSSFQKREVKRVVLY